MSATSTVIVGGGFGGISAANTLRRLLPPEHGIVVVDETPDFYVGAGKTWIMLGERTYEDISRPRAELLAAGVRFLQARITGFDFAKRTVATGRETLGWDHLVIALGADLNLSAVPGLAEAAHTFYTVEGAERLRPVLEDFRGGDIAILIPGVPFKCPPAPYEAAMLLHHRLGSRGPGGKARIAIYTAEGAPMATAGPEMGQYIRNELAQRGIAFHPQKKTVRVEGAARRVAFEDGGEARYDLLIAVPPHEAPAVVRNARLVNPSGWIPVDPVTLEVKSISVEEVYAIGDITAVPLPGRYKPDMPLSLPKAGVFAEAHGRTVAHRIAAKVLGAEPTETFDGKGYCYLELGAARAVKADGSFFDLPHPMMRKQVPDEAQLRDKLDWVARHLQPPGAIPG
ncbi:MAG: NAD(P)/FAD-dependent oxidoreductase [Betaproteobacteria bacterium]|nr:NAD(P)/FAD-dependent oxidoreductase [Betaproteobacteria bacterium]